MTRVGVHLAMVALVGALSGAVLVEAASPTQAAKSDGKAFAGALRPQAATDARTAPTADRVPGFASNPAESAYYGAPDTLTPAAEAAKASSTGYNAVTSSIAARATFAPADIDSTVARGKLVAGDPMTYVSGFAATGTPGSCHPLPETAVSPGSYEQSCNSGYVADTSTQSCTIALNVVTSSVYKYECSPPPSDLQNNVDSCDIFPGVCTDVGSRPGKCLQWSGPPWAQWCSEPGEPITQLDCPATVPGATLLGTDNVLVSATPDTSACAALDATSGCVADPDFCTDSSPVTRIVGGVAVTQPCWAWSRTYQCGSLTPKTDCDQLEAMGCSYLREQCITDEIPCLTVDKVYACPLPPQPGGKTQAICDGDIYCLNGECDTVDRQPNTEFKDAAVALNAMSQAGKEWDPGTLSLFKGARLTCSKTIFGLTNCCVPRGLPLIGGCNSEDAALKAEREKGLCTFVGSFCSSKFLGICLQKKEAHCCFASKISRILQEQGRPQIGKPWGDPKTEQCLGFTIDEFARLDLSRMDFSEVYAEFTDAAKLPDEMTLVGEMQTKITAFYAAHK